MRNKSSRPKTSRSLSQRLLSGEFSARRPRLSVEQLEDRIAPVGDLVYQAIDATPLTLQLTTDEVVQIVNTNAPTTVLASKPLNEITEGVRIEGAGHDVRLTIDASVPEVTGGIEFDAGSGTNTLIGPALENIWTLTGTGTGHLQSPEFLHYSGV